MIDLGKYGKHAHSILLYIYEHNEIPITRLSELVKTSPTYTRTVELMAHDGLINTREVIRHRRYRLISLTDKGKALAESLIRTEQELSTSNSSSLYTLPPNYEEQFKDLCTDTNLNTLNDRIAIKELNYDDAGHDRVVFVYVRLNGNNIMRLWCEADNTYDCPHTRFAWTLPDVQAMIQIQRDRGNIKKVE